MDQQPTGKKREIIAVLAVLIVIVVIVAATAFANKKDDTSSSNTNGTTTAAGDDTTDDTTDDTNGKPSYTDGSYSATGQYTSPGGRESIEVTVELADGVIKDVSASANASDAEAEEYQNMFLSAYKDLVVGKNIDDVSLSRVSGSSLTSQGFNNAIDTIKQDAETSA